MKQLLLRLWTIIWREIKTIAGIFCGGGILIATLFLYAIRPLVDATANLIASYFKLRDLLR